MGCNEEEVASLIVPINKTRGNGDELKYMTFLWNTTYFFIVRDVICWQRWWSLHLTLKTQQIVVLNNLL